jgi:hypothetical protein
MIFSYVRYELDPTAAIPHGAVYRPRIPIRITGPKRSLQIFGLLDTGADHVFLSASVAAELGILPTQNVETAFGAGGHEIDVWPGEVEIELTDGKETLRWAAQVGFLGTNDDPPVAFLGNVGFLEYFQATFDYDEQSIELEPKEDEAISRHTARRRQ